MNYYLDFDYTLFDVYEFRKHLYRILEMNGFDKTYLALTPEMKTNGQKLLNIKEVFTSLSKSRNIPVENFLKPLQDLYGICDEFVYDDTEEFLQYLKSKGHKVYALTWGDKSFQEEKLRASKLYDSFDEIIYAEQLKYTLDLDYTNGVFIDDSIRDLEGLLNRLKEENVENPERYLYRIKRPNGKNSNKEGIPGILEFNSLRELQQYLSKKEKMNAKNKKDN